MIRDVPARVTWCKRRNVLDDSRAHGDLVAVGWMRNEMISACCSCAQQRTLHSTSCLSPTRWQRRPSTTCLGSVREALVAEYRSLCLDLQAEIVSFLIHIHNAG